MHLFNDLIDIGVEHQGALAMLNWAIYLHILALVVTFAFLIRRAFNDSAKEAEQEREMQKLRGEGKKH